MALEEVLPAPDFSERHSRRVRAEPAQALAAVRELTIREVPTMLVLMSLRSLPALLSRRYSLPRTERILDAFAAMGFAEADGGADELILVGVGRFWRLDGGLRRVRAEEFPAFDEPGFVKAATNFRAEPGLLSTETRVKATDEQARRSFARYWRLIQPGSALIRMDWLRAARRRAERST